MQLGSLELWQFSVQREGMRIWPDCVMEIRIILQCRTFWCAVCPSAACHSTQGCTPNEKRILAHFVLGSDDSWGTLDSESYQGLSSDLRSDGTTNPGVDRCCMLGDPGKSCNQFNKSYAEDLGTNRYWFWQTIKYLAIILLLLDPTTLNVTTALHKRVFCFFGLLEQIHFGTGKQF